MSDPIDEIVERAMEHKMVLQVGVDPAQPDPTMVVGGVVFGRCTKGCSVSVGTLTGNDEAVFNLVEAESRHRLYVAITEALERHVQSARATKVE
jgi:hypothetical protein